MTKYEMLTNILDRICAEGRSTKIASRYAEIAGNPESLNQIRSRAFIHLYLMVRFGIVDFIQREHRITDGSSDGGIDGYNIDEETRTIYLIQSKFRANGVNFEAKEIKLEEILRMDISRILEGHQDDENGVRYRGKILQMQQEITNVADIGRYSYKVVILANISDTSPSKLKQLTGGFPTEIVNAEECYKSLMFPVISGTYFNASDLNVYLDLSNKSSSSSKISYMVTTEHSECEITVVFIPTIEIARTLSRYKNSILKFNPRSYLELGGVSVNDAIRASIETKTTNEFALLNNGITMLSDDTRINERIGQRNKAQLIVTNPQIINGGQTAYTLGRIFEDHGQGAEQVFANKEVLLKIITILEPEGKKATDEQRIALIEQISTATNQQTAVAKADRISNEKVYLDIQRNFFDKFGLLIERKRGEFADGLHKHYVKEADIIERNKLFRVYFAVIGKLAEGASKKSFLNCAHPETIIADDDIMRQVYFGIRCHAAIAGHQKRGQRLERDRKTVYQIYALSQKLPEDASCFDELLHVRIDKFAVVWENFVAAVTAETGSKYVKVVKDVVSGTPVAVLNTGKLLRSGTFETRVKEYFKDYAWE